MLADLGRRVIREGTKYRRIDSALSLRVEFSTLVKPSRFVSSKTGLQETEPKLCGRAIREGKKISVDRLRPIDSSRVFGG